MTATETAPATSSEEHHRLPPAKTPRSSTLVDVIYPLLGLAAVVLGVIGLRDVVTRLKWVDGDEWLPSVARSIDGLHANGWILATAIIVGLIGLALLAAALRPRPSRFVTADAGLGFHMRPVGVARLASAAASDVPGVFKATSSASRKTVRVRVSVANGSSDLKEQVENAVERSMKSFDHPPRVRVKVSGLGSEG